MEIKIKKGSSLNEKSLSDLISGVSDQFDADIFLYSGPIDDQGYGEIVDAVTFARRRNVEKKNALLILTTNGGKANPAYQIARVFQNTYEHFFLCTPSFCKSAGTIVALGAHVLYMDIFSELGPMDVQLVKENEILTRKSGLLSRSAFESLQDSAFSMFEYFMLKITLASGGNVSFRVASEISAQMASSLLSNVYSQINPEIVGSEFRDLNIALQYGARLIEESGNADFDTVLHLVHGYPSHDFIIDNREARNLFKHVEYPTPELYELLGSLGSAVYQEREPHNIIFLDPDFEKQAKDSDSEGDEGDANSKNEDEAKGQMADGGAPNRKGDSRKKRGGGNETGDAGTATADTQH